MQIKKYKSALIALLCLPLFSLAQQNTISPYSAFGIGEFQNQGFAFNNSLGGIGVALRPDNALNPINPASLSALSLTSFEAGISGSAMFLADNNLSQEYFSSTLGYLSLGFPISEGFAISGGLLPYTYQGYDLSQSFETTFGEDTVAYNVNYKGSGGFNRAYVNFGLKLFKGLSVGASGNMIFGTLNQQTDVVFDHETAINSRDDNAYYVRDFTIDGGLQYQTTWDDKYLTVGATYTPESNLNASNSGATYTYNIISDFEYIRDTVEISGRSTDGLVLPQSYALGLALGKNDNWFVSAEYDFKQWTSVSLFGEEDPKLKDATQLKLGAWWIPNVQDVHNYWNTIQYRAGLNYNTGFLSVSAFGNQDGVEDIKDMSVSLGLGLPMKRSKTTANIGMQFGRRGTLEKGLVEEKYIKFQLAFTFNDKWFTKRKID